MGISAQQHRVTTGLYNQFNYQLCGVSRSRLCKDKASGKILFLNFVCVSFLILYCYILLLTMAMYVDIFKLTHSYNTPPLGINFTSSTIFFKVPIKRDTLNAMFIFLIRYIPYLLYIPYFLYFMKDKCSMYVKTRKVYKKYRNMGLVTYLSHIYTLWLLSINLVLLIISNPGIVNPGPDIQNKNRDTGLSVLYHNVRGFMSYNPRLPMSPPNINTTKVLEFQAYIFQHKPDIIILNETWLMKNINSSEIFPNNSYKVFRADRSNKTHPFDANNPKKNSKKWWWCSYSC